MSVVRPADANLSPREANEETQVRCESKSTLSKLAQRRQIKLIHIFENQQRVFANICIIIFLTLSDVILQTYRLVIYS